MRVCIRTKDILLLRVVHVPAEFRREAVILVAIIRALVPGQSRDPKGRTSVTVTGPKPLN